MYRDLAQKDRRYHDEIHWSNIDRCFQNVDVLVRCT